MTIDPSSQPRPKPTKPASSHPTVQSSLPTRANSTPITSPGIHRRPSASFLSSRTTNGSSGGGGGSGLLLRLFESEFFNVHLAISYLKTYHDSIGITYYLINRLNRFPPQEVEFYWPQLCHLLISRPSESFALESFIITKSQQSTHLAMKTLWYLQASLSDLSSNPNTPNFIICRRAFNRVQSIIFSDPLLELSTQRRQVDPRVNKPMALNLTSSPVPYAPDQASTTHPNHRPAPKASHWKNIKRQTFKDLAQLKGGKISEKILPSTVGMGLALAGIALPQMSQQTGHVPIEQSRDYGQNITIDSRGRNKSVDDNSASEEDEFDQIRSPNAKQKSSSISRKRSNLLSTNPQITTRTRHQSFRASGPRSQILTPANSSSQGSPRYTSHSAHSAHASNHSFNNKQTQLMNHAEESATLAALSPDWHSSFNQAQPQSLSYSLSTPTILTAPISSPHLFPRVSSPLPNLDPHQTSPSFQSASSSSNQVSNYALPTVTRHSGQRGAGSVGVHSSRAHPAAPISQSAPSLPDALSNFKLDSRLHHSHAPTSHRNGKQSLQFTTSSPLRSLFSALSMDPSEIPTSLLNQVLQS